MFPMARGKSNQTSEDYVEKLVKEVSEAHELARTKLKMSLKRMKRNYDLRILTRTYEEGDAVYVLDTATLKGKCKKLSPPWKGPGIIEKKISSYIYRVKMRNAVFVMNHDRLKPCKDRQLPKWIQTWRENPQEVNSDESEELYCLCRKPWNGRFMIACDFCNEWFHGSCVNITQTEALSIDKYKCTQCKGGSRSDAKQ